MIYADRSRAWPISIVSLSFVCHSEDDADLRCTCRANLHGRHEEYTKSLFLGKTRASNPYLAGLSGKQK
jgi:hypothetical protein